MDFPLISLVIPVYNTEKFLGMSLESAISQNYPNLEILILNNGSTDGSQVIIDRYAKLDPRIVTYTINHVESVKESKDNCYYRAKGEWIVTLDSDDAIENNYVTDLWRKHLDTSADVVTGRMISVDLDGNEFSKLPEDIFDFEEVINGKRAMSRTIKIWEFGMNGALICKRCFNNIYIDNPNCLFYTDEVDSRLFLLAASKVAFSKAEYYYTFNPNSTGKKLSWDKYKYKMNTRLGLLKIVENEYGKNSIEYGSVIYQALGVVYLAIKYFASSKNNTKEQKREFKQMSNKLLKAIDLKRLRLSTLLFSPIKLAEEMIISLV